MINKVYINTNKDTIWQKYSDQLYNKYITHSATQGGGYLFVVPEEHFLTIGEDEVILDEETRDLIVLIECDSSGEVETIRNQIFTGLKNSNPKLFESHVYPINSIEEDSSNFAIGFRYPVYPILNIVDIGDLAKSKKILDSEYKDRVIGLYLKEDWNYPVDNKLFKYHTTVKIMDRNNTDTFFNRFESQFKGSRWRIIENEYDIISKDGIDILEVDTILPPFIGFIDEVKVIDPESNKYEITITCKSDYDAAKLGSSIYYQLVGRYEYVNNQVILNITNNVVSLVIGNDTAIEPLIFFTK